MKMKPFPVNSDGTFSWKETLQFAKRHNAKISSQDLLVVNESLKIISKECGIPIPEIFFKRRFSKSVEARALFVFALSIKTVFTDKVIGGFLNGRDHSSIIHMRERHLDFMKLSDERSLEYQRLAQLVEQGLKDFKKDPHRGESDLTFLITQNDRRQDLLKFAELLECVDYEERVEEHMLANPLIRS